MDFLCSQALPSFGPPSLDDQSSATRSHSDEEAMGSFSLAVVGLERSLHSLSNPREKLELNILSSLVAIVKSWLFPDARLRRP
jgi:hypothetical protein